MNKFLLRGAGLVIMLTVASMATSCNAPAPAPPAPDTRTEREASHTLGAVTTQRIADLKSVNALLEAYHAAHGAYPVATGAQGYASAWGASLGANWIPELQAALPRDPALSEAGNEPQYLYISNGVDYKLIAHAVDDCSPEVEIDGVRIDPNRTGAEGSCWAYGFWSAGGAGM